MLTSLIAVLLLLVIGFYAVFIGAVGRAGNGEAPLSAPRRLGMMVIGLAALGVAYLVYSHPSSLQSSARAPKSWSAATPSNPPETRGDVASVEAATAADPAAADNAGPEAAPAPSTASAEPTPIPPAEGDGEVSAAATAMEAELLRRRQGLPRLPQEPETPAVVAAPAKAEAETVATATAAASAPVAAPSRTANPARSSTGSTRATARTGGSATRATTRPLGPARPLTIVIRNELGDRQESERLSLVIEGKRVASFEITDVAPVIELPVDLPRPGLLHYKLEGESVQGRSQTLRGQGCISAVDGALFHVRRNPGSQRVFLESTRG